MIELKLVTIYKDGGTEAYLVTDGLGNYLGDGYVYYLDNRFHSQTKGHWYIGYPEAHYGNILGENLLMVQKMNKALSIFKNR